MQSVVQTLGINLLGLTSGPGGWEALLVCCSLAWNQSSDAVVRMRKVSVCCLLPHPHTTLCLPIHTTLFPPLQVKDLLMPYGALKSFNLVMDKSTGKSKVGVCKNWVYANKTKCANCRAGHTGA